MFNFRGLLGHVIVLIALAPSIVCGQNDVLLSCSFEDDICSYVHRDNLGDFRWQRHEADTPSLYTGPSAAYDGRFYLYIEATHNSRGDKAVLQTLGMNYDSVICVSFAYHMFGENIGALVVRTSGSRGERLLDKRGNQGNVWIRRTVQTTIDQWASIFFEAEKGYDYRSDIAIDQFSARKGSCDFSTCDLTNGGCEHICHPANSGRYCSCHDGFRLIGDTTCNDIDECDNNNRKCQQGCLNRIGSYSCSICSSGYAKNMNGRTCDDVDECDVSNGGCQHSCVNLDGSYSCFCNQGFVLSSNGKSCADINECSVNNGGCQYSCHNIDGSFICCDLGYGPSLDGNSCADVDECSTHRDGCQHGCNNTQGSYSCYCGPGYSLALDKHNCTDTNECSVNNGGCQYSCHNIDGSFICCDLGYGLSLDGNSCADINECDTNQGGCQHGCLNSDGSYFCNCSMGYELTTDLHSCSDINECSVNNGGCPYSCHNIDASYICCDLGYGPSLDGNSCADINECDISNGGCRHNCTNIDGGFTCDCDPGHQLASDGLTCNDIDECAEGSSDCAVGCLNTPSSYLCHCDTGQVLGADKHSCEASTSGPGAGVLAGSIVGPVVVIALVAFLVVFFIRRGRGRRNKETSNDGSTGGIPLPMTSVDPEDGLTESATALYVNLPSPSASTATTSSPLHKVSTSGAHAAKPASLKKDPDVSETAKPRPTGDAAPKDKSSKVDDRMLERSAHQALTAAELLTYMKTLAKDEGYETEFDNVPKDQLYPWTAAVREGLKAKNRFKNIMPYDKNRVLLHILNGDPLTDFISASYIDGYSKEDTFIASHGPTEVTKSDFWRMIWEKDVSCIVMVTNIIEAGNVRCAKYWPDTDEDMLFGDVTVKQTNEESWPGVRIRTFDISKEDETRVVEQCHYTSWPDHGVPEDATSILRFHKRVRQRMKPGRPTVVHCSAGVGRTGTFIAIDYLQQQAEHEGKVDVFKCVSNLRHQKIQMVQTRTQYEFIYCALLEALLIGDTSIPCDKFTSLVEDGYDTIQHQFQILEELKPSYTKEELAIASCDENRDKNRDKAILPRGAWRVFLTSRCKDRNDYINGVFVHSYKKKNAFIATQMPLEDTVIDFWRMIHDLACGTVVLLGQKVTDLLPDLHDNVCTLGKYQLATSTPRGASAEMTETIVTVDKITQQPTYQNVEMVADKGKICETSPLSPHAVTCRVLRVPAAQPADLSASLLTRLYAVAQEVSGDKLIVFVCRDGALLSGVTIASFSMFDMMSMDNAVDVFHIAKQIKNSRPEFIPTLDQYRQLHEMAGDYIKQFGTYDNFR